jgi:hypothetical protein
MNNSFPGSERHELPEVERGGVRLGRASRGRAQLEQGQQEVVVADGRGALDHALLDLRGRLLGLLDLLLLLDGLAVDWAVGLGLLLVEQGLVGPPAGTDMRKEPASTNKRDSSAYLKSSSSHSMHGPSSSPRL